MFPVFDIMRTHQLLMLANIYRDFFFRKLITLFQEKT